MARRYHRFNKAELNDITISLIFLAGSMNCLVGALLLKAGDKTLELLIGGGVLGLIMALIWFFSNPFKSNRPLSKLRDVITAAIIVLLGNALLVSKCWPIIFFVVLESFVMIRFYRNGCPKRR